MTEDEMNSGLTEIFRDLFADDALVLTPEMTARDVAGWDQVEDGGDRQPEERGRYRADDPHQGVPGWTLGGPASFGT